MSRRGIQQPAASRTRHRVTAGAPYGPGKSSGGIISGRVNPLLEWSFETAYNPNGTDCSIDPFQLGDEQIPLGIDLLPQWPHGYQPNIPASGFADFTPRLTPGISPSARSTTSSVTEATSISNGATLSPVNTDFQSAFDGQSAVSTWSRGPSPLQQLAGQDDHRSVPPSEAACVDTSTSSGPGVVSDSADEAPPDLQHPLSHVCSWARCPNPGFRTREGLNWHVMADHLLVCPVPGCSEANFQSKKMLNSHLRVLHSTSDEKSFSVHGERAAKTVQPVLPVPPADPSADESQTPKQNPSWDAVNDPAMKMALSIATSKRKCREQLKTVLEKRLKRAAVTGMVIPQRTERPLLTVIQALLVQSERQGP